MAPLTLTTLLALSATAAAAANSEITWGAVVFTYHGEKVPALSNGPYNLSPVGANQLHDAGSMLRSRYIDPSSNASALITAAPINGLSTGAIDNSQMYVLSTEDEFISGSALAFLQGLYPPRNAVMSQEETILSNQTLQMYPLNGYQYPSINTVSPLDFNYIWIAGNQECTNYDLSQLKTMSSQVYSQEATEYSGFYQSLNQGLFSQLDPADISYDNAYLLYEYALYQYNHNSSFYNDPSSSAIIDQLSFLASQSEFGLNTPNSDGNVPAIAGATLASVIIQQFSHVISSQGVSDKLTLLFGSFEPMLSFFSLSSLSSGPAASMFTSLPQHGSLMAFELFSYPAENSSDTFPAVDELWVRFLFRNGTDDANNLVSYPLFDRGNEEVDMSWTDFVAGMGAFSMNEVSDWCNACQSATLFCQAILYDTQSSSNSNGSPSTPGNRKKDAVSPAVGGVIGAVVTLAVCAILAALLAFLGYRIDRHGKKRSGSAAAADGPAGIAGLRQSNSGGGFKGAEKLASDTDLALKDGAGASVTRHERTGSWEMTQNPTRAGLERDVESGKAVSSANYARRSEDGLGNVNPFGDPVKPLDQV